MISLLSPYRDELLLHVEMMSCYLEMHMVLEDFGLPGEAELRPEIQGQHDLP